MRYTIQEDGCDIEMMLPDMMHSDDITILEDYFALVISTLRRHQIAAVLDDDAGAHLNQPDDED